MDAWQQEHIHNNKEMLIKLTTSLAALLAFLKKEDVIGRMDIEEIVSFFLFQTNLEADLETFFIIRN